MCKSVFFICFLVIFGAASYAQEKSTISGAQKQFDKAQESLKNQSYDTALQLLQSAVDADPKFQSAYIQIGDVYRRLRKFDSAKQAYLKVLAITSSPDPRVYYFLADVELHTGDYANAKTHYQQFIVSGANPELLVKAKKYLIDCNFAIQAKQHPQKYEPLNMGAEINSSYRDYFPALTADGSTLIFSRVIDGNEDFFLSEKNSSGSWTTAKPMSTVINTKKYNEGAQSISPDGMYLYFTGCNRPDGAGSCDIYVSHKKGKDWDTPFNLGETVNSPHWDSQPAISPDGNTLYFVSNRPGGLGGYDIWKSMLSAEGTWSKAVNLGPEVNTPYDENTPFIHPDGKTLYFASDGWPGFGDKDIFLSHRDGDHWSTPINLGYPINTFNEENGLIVSADGKLGFFSSNLVGGFGDMDIYKFNMPDAAKPGKVTYVKGTVKDKITKETLESLVLVVDTKTKETKFNDFTSEETGTFLAVMPLGSNYVFNVSSDGYIFYSDNFELKDATFDKPYELEINLERIKVGTNLTLKNIFFDVNKFDLLPTSITELNTLIDLLKVNPTVCIEIQGHTDNTGVADQNSQLSDNRAKAVYDYLISQQIDPERLSHTGFGASKPIADNGTEAGRKQNRRTSFLITKI
ncbi:OmpA family protein [Pedobacter duraquae]|uniref:WD40 repeat protein n=1 Tax=Pedobacter duraquae TaxID=425511 RepID=A0A4R6IP16_9SPHI|nr:OmpA family protein [Pedobacter duraquae]TDO24014.1 WD40 repeat protein [Pedobacter duraquae]